MNCCDFECNFGPDCSARISVQRIQRRVKPYPNVVAGEPDERAGLPVQYAEGHEDDPDGLMQQADVVSSVVETGARVFLWVMVALAVVAAVVAVGPVIYMQAIG